MSPHQGWENLSDREEGKLASAEECRKLCVEQPECTQYSLDQDRTCRTRVEPKLGRAMRGVSSGWMFDRVTELQKGLASCGQQF